MYVSFFFYLRNRPSRQVRTSRVRQIAGCAGHYALMTCHGCWALVTKCTSSHHGHSLVNKARNFKSFVVLGTKQEPSDPEEQEIDSLELNSEGERVSRRDDASWCVYERCSVMPSEVECICCKELAFLSKLVEGLFLTSHFCYSN